MIIAGVDIRNQYGIRAGKKAYSEIEKSAKAKKGYEYDFTDENGIQTDPNEVTKFERKTYQIPLVLIANNLTDFLNKKRAFEQFLYGLKEFNLDVPFLSRRWKVRYSEITNLDILNISNVNGKNVCRFTLVLTDDYPTINFPIV